MQPDSLRGVGLGPKSCAWLAQLGIHDLAALQGADAVGLYLQIKATVPGVSLNLLWALVGAQTGRPWQQIARERRSDLLLELDMRRQAPP